METLIDEVIMEILSWLPVKLLLRLRCVSKSWNSLILHPTFVNLHLEKSPKNVNLVLTLRHYISNSNVSGKFIMPCSKSSLMENPSSTIIAAQEGQLRLNDKYRAIGSCNGLVCLRGFFGRTDGCFGKGDEDHLGKYWFRFWNPATRLRSKKSPHLSVDLRINLFSSTQFGFGYDKSSDTYKVVAILSDSNATEDSKRTQVKVYNMGDHCWRDIERFPAFPLLRNDGRFLNGTLNWLAIRNFTSGYGFNGNTLATHQLVIVSLDVGTETYKQMMLPDGLDETTHLQPSIGIFWDCLCLLFDHNKTHFVLWQMKEFGVEESWNRLMNVSYQHLQIDRTWWPWPRYFSALPLCVSEDGDVLMMTGNLPYKTIMYYRRDNRVEHAKIPKNRSWIDAMDYVQSLVLPR